MFFYIQTIIIFICTFFFFFFNDTATTEIYTLSLHDALPIFRRGPQAPAARHPRQPPPAQRSEEHTSELQSQFHLVCRLLLEKKKKQPSKAQRRRSRSSTARTLPGKFPP